MAPDTEVLPSEEARKWRLQPSDPVLLGLLVFYACLFGIYTRPVGFLATLWPANAVMLGILLLRPDSARASGWLAAAAAYLAADLMTGSDLTKAVLLNLGNLVGVGTAYAICVRLPPNTVRLRQPGSMLYIALASAAGAAAVGVVGAFLNPFLFGGSSITGSLFWFATEFVNYIAILPVILSWPAMNALAGPFRKGRAYRAASVRLPSLRSVLPVMALVLSCLAGVVIGGPGAVAFAVPALLWCGLAYPVFPTAVLTFLVGWWSLIAISIGYYPTSVGLTDEMSLVSIRLGASLVALAPLTLATVMQSRNELIDMLNRSRRRLDLALDAGGIVGTWSLGTRAPGVNVNRTLVDLHGMSREKARHGPDEVRSAFVHPADRDRVQSALEGALASKSDYQCRFRVVTSSNEIHWLIASGKPVGARRGSAGRLAGIVIDVTDHVETEVALQQSNLRFQIVTESIPQIVWSTDAEGRHDYFNQRWVEFTGIGVAATGPETWKTLVHRDDWPRVDVAWRESLASGKTYDIDFRLRHQDGTFRWLRFLAKPIRDTDGNITRWYGTSTDIEDAKHLEIERELVAHELDHRIKNLFTLVNGLVSLSVREQPALRALAEPLGARLSALHQAHSLVSATSGAKSGMLKALLQQLLRPYEQLGTDKISISGRDVEIDAGAFKSMALILHELITNSAKYGALSQKEGRLQVGVHVEEDYLTITWGEQFSGTPDREETNGFGSTLIKTLVENQLRGSFKRNLHGNGLSISVTLPWSAVCVTEQTPLDQSGSR